MPRYLLTLPDGFSVEPYPPIAFDGIAHMAEVGGVAWHLATGAPAPDGFDVLLDGVSLVAPDLLPPDRVYFVGPFSASPGDVIAVRALAGGAVVAAIEYTVPSP